MNRLTMSVLHVLWLAFAGMMEIALVGSRGLADEPVLGNALQDPRNPIRVLYRGERLDLWSLQPIRRPTPPRAESNGAYSPIDAFLESAWYREGLDPAPELERADWIQRATLDLTGLRATIDEVESFVSDSSPDAYERVIDRLLASPSYGEHRARMWLDVVRYSDSNGFDWDEFRKTAWRYRDWVVRAWNQDLPFDRFVTMQLAGDEMVEGAPRSIDEQDCLIATGYLRLGPFDNAAPLFNEQDRARVEVLTDLTETTASVFLAMTLSCCRCHDHKTDPLSHADHYRFRAFFAAARFADDRPINIVGESEQSPEPLTTGLIMKDDATNIDPIHVLYQGDHRAPREAVEPGFPSVLFPNPPRMESMHPSQSTGRRSTLARWICSSENPWTARVAVNRQWQQLFGVGLVATPNDFGLTGDLPTHGELLDYLASELVGRSWSMKSIERQLVASMAYRRCAVPNQGLVRGIASARTELKRLSAEQLRDCILQVSELLQHRAGGPPVWPILSPEILQANPAVLDDNETKTKGWYPSAVSEQSVRSLYLIQKRTMRLPWMETFDQPENTVSCPRRETSIVAPQALSMMNGELVSQAALAIGQSLANEPDSRFVTEVFERVLARKPTQAETARCCRFLQDRSRTALALVLINSNEFAFIP
jgi:hypothetical protein